MAPGGEESMGGREVREEEGHAVRVVREFRLSTAAGVHGSIECAKRAGIRWCYGAETGTK